MRVQMGSLFAFSRPPPTDDPYWGFLGDAFLWINKGVSIRMTLRGWPPRGRFVGVMLAVSRKTSINVGVAKRLILFERIFLKKKST